MVGILSPQETLDLAQVLRGLLALSVTYIFVGVIVNYYKLPQFKGPRLAGFSRTWMFWHAVNARLNKKIYYSVKQYGPVARIGPNLLAIGDPDILRHISAPRSKWRRAPWYDSVKFDPRQDTVFSTRDEKMHTELKAKVAGGYHGRDIDTLEPDIDFRTVEFIEMIKVRYDGKTMDMAPIVRYYVLDVLSTVAFGSPFGFMAANDDKWGYNGAMNDVLIPIELSANHNFFRRIVSSSIVQKLLMPKPTDKNGVGAAVGFSQRAVAERYGPNAKVKKDMLGHLVSKGFNQLQCEAEAFLQIIAGSDSTTAILRCAMYSLGGNPVAYMKLQREIDTAMETGNISRPVIKYAEATQLPYLQACLWETFRMFPPLFGLKTKMAPPEGETIKGIFFPGGVEVTSCDDAMCRNTDIFGDDVDDYRPERWMEADTATRQKYERAVDTIFGAGRWLCLGRHIAMMELHKSIFELMWHFDWVLKDPLKGIGAAAHGAHVHWDMFMIARSRR